MDHTGTAPSRIDLRGAAGLFAALARHYEELVDHVRRHIGRRGGDHGLARDVVHDVCVQLGETPPRDEVRAALPFLRHVATCRAIDLHRIEQGRRAWVTHLPQEPGTAERACDRALAQDPQRIAAGRQGLRALAAAIDALPPRCREVFVMHKVHALPQAEVAQRLGISLKAVEKHLRLGMAACHRALADAAPGALP